MARPLSLLSFAALAVMVAAGASLARTPPESFADLTAKLLPAVVNISTSQTVTRKEEMEELDPNDPFEQWFKEFDRRRQGDQELLPDRPKKRKQTSLGSGFIIDKAGYIVTNSHVVADADKISVTLHDDTVLDAKLVGRDEKTDIALLKITTTKPLTAVAWGDSDAVRVGDWAVAIGNPFGLGGTVTAGIISARARDIDAGQYDDFLQTDAAINRGNSGGPLFNLDGEVIGVNTAIFSPSGMSVGVGFAAAANLLKPVLADLRQFGRTRRGWLGVEIQSVSPEMAESIGLDKARGAMVAGVNPAGPAGKAGFEVGDVILSFDRKPIDKMRSLPRVVAETPIDKNVDVQLWRKGQAVTTTVRVAELKEDVPQLAAVVSPEVTRAAERIRLPEIGLTVTPVTEAIRKQFDLAEEAEGLLVVAVEDDSDAAEKGVQRGDVIDEIQQQSTLTGADAKAAIAKAQESKRASVLLRVISGKKVGFIGVKVAKR